MNSNIITISEIKQQVNSQTFTRAYNYYTENLVDECKVIKMPNSKRSAMILSSVEGNSYYDQNIHLTNGTIDGNCSCPVGYNCKHVIAALFHAIHEENLNGTKKEVDPIDQWLNQFKALQVKETENLIPQNDYFLIYRLFIENHGDNQLNFYKAKILKNGNLSKGTKLSNDNYLYAYSYQYDYVNDLDKELASSLDTISTGYSSDLNFKEEQGNALLQKVIKSNRCFFKDASTPLRMISVKKTLTFEWKTKDEHSWM
jgi:hypothetical protein